MLLQAGRQYFVLARQVCPTPLAGCASIPHTSISVVIAAKAPMFTQIPSSFLLAALYFRTYHHLHGVARDVSPVSATNQRHKMFSFLQNQKESVLSTHC